jgi:secreted trypsin-like serine protease
MRIHGRVALLLALACAAEACAPEPPSEGAARAGSEDEIIAGQRVSQSEYDADYPWMLAMGMRGSDTDGEYVVHCGAELIGPDVVLTAGHCVTATEGEPVVLGARTMMFARGTVHRSAMSTRADGSSTFVARRVDRHPAYAPGALDSDVAIVRLKSAQPGPYATLAEARLDDGSTLHAIGWGDTRRRRPEGDPTPRPAEQLRRTALTFVDRATCRAAYEDRIESSMTTRMLCASGVGLGDDGKASGVCNGDSGGPLLVETPDGLRIAGLASWVLGCGTQRFPNVFARIDGGLRSWIDACARDENACAIPPH